MSGTEKVKGPASYFPSIEAKYGEPIAHWQAIIRSQAGKKHMELVAYLKAEHGLGRGVEFDHVTVAVGGDDGGQRVVDDGGLQRFSALQRRRLPSGRRRGLSQASLGSLGR